MDVENSKRQALFCCKIRRVILPLSVTEIQAKHASTPKMRSSAIIDFIAAGRRL